MVVGTLEISVRLSEIRSLKDKRRVLRSLIERIRNEFQVAVAEVDDTELWGNAVVGVACVSNDAGHAEAILQRVMDTFDQQHEMEVDGFQRDVYRTS
jgi:uncharacterized protein